MDFTSRAVRSLVELHEREVRAFVECWLRFRASGCALPEAHGDPDYESPDRLVTHVLVAAARYLTWIGECTGRPVNDLFAERVPERVAPRPAEYAEEVLAAWRRHLAALADAEISPRTYVSRWGETFTIEQMLEHAVVHPMRHRIQLERLLRD